MCDAFNSLGMVGVTGTDAAKTTTTHLIAHVLG